MSDREAETEPEPGGTGDDDALADARARIVMATSPYFQLAEAGGAVALFQRRSGDQMLHCTPDREGAALGPQLVARDRLPRASALVGLALDAAAFEREVAAAGGFAVGDLVDYFHRGRTGSVTTWHAKVAAIGADQGDAFLTLRLGKTADMRARPLDAYTGAEQRVDGADAARLLYRLTPPETLSATATAEVSSACGEAPDALSPEQRLEPTARDAPKRKRNRKSHGARKKHNAANVAQLAARKAAEKTEAATAAYDAASGKRILVLQVGRVNDARLELAASALQRPRMHSGANARVTALKVADAAAVVATVAQVQPHAVVLYGHGDDEAPGRLLDADCGASTPTAELDARLQAAAPGLVFKFFGYCHALPRAGGGGGPAALSHGAGFVGAVELGLSVNVAEAVLEALITSNADGGCMLTRVQASPSLKGAAKRQLGWMCPSLLGRA